MLFRNGFSIEEEERARSTRVRRCCLRTETEEEEEEGNEVLQQIVPRRLHTGPSRYQQTNSNGDKREE